MSQAKVKSPFPSPSAQERREKVIPVILNTMAADTVDIITECDATGINRVKTVLAVVKLPAAHMLPLLLLLSLLLGHRSRTMSRTGSAAWRMSLAH